MSKPITDFFNKEMAENYDERNSKLSSISTCLHFLMGLVLKDLPERARILCVGAGTGAEILSLAKIYPGWTFVALEPSESMLEVCRERVKEAGISDRCEFVHGYIQDLPLDPKYNAVLSILVTHFVKREEKLDFFRHISDRLLNGGYIVNAEIGFDLESEKFPLMLSNWEAVQTLMGATAASLAGLPQMLKQVLSVVAPEETERLIKQSGIKLPVRFFQAFMISACYGKKEV